MYISRELPQWEIPARAPSRANMDLRTAIAACREVRSSFSKIFNLPSHFRFAKEDSTLHSLLFLCAAGGGGNSLYSLELSSAGEEKTWEKISSSGGVRQLSRAEQLLKERMRATGSGITHYEYQSDGDRLLVQDGPYCRLLDRSKASYWKSRSCTASDVVNF